MAASAWKRKFHLCPRDFGFLGAHPVTQGGEAQGILLESLWSVRLHLCHPLVRPHQSWGGPEWPSSALVQLAAP